jgi:hypothetical protein
VSGAAGVPPTANAEGASSGSGGGIAILSSQAPETFGIAIDTGGGANGEVSVPNAAPAGTSSVPSGNQCTTSPVLTLGVSAGALNSCTVTVAGSSCGASPSPKLGDPGRRRNWRHNYANVEQWSSGKLHGFMRQRIHGDNLHHGRSRRVRWRGMVCRVPGLVERGDRPAAAGAGGDAAASIFGGAGG